MSWHFLGSSVTILCNIILNNKLSKKLWLGQCQKPLWYSDLDLSPMTLARSWHFLGSSVIILWNIIPIHAFSENLWSRKCLNHYEHSDLYLWPIALNQGHDISLGAGQQSCEILFKSIKMVRIYGPDKLFAYVLTIKCIVTLTFDQWSWVKVMTLPCPL
jgi:hypothetical protein